MNLYFKIALCLVFVPAMLSAAPARDGGAAFADAEGKEWILTELRRAGETVRADGMGDVFTITFQAAEGRLSGMGAPNRYFGPYTAGSNRALSIGNLASTQMMAFREPDGLKESEYFNYLSNVTRWDLDGPYLELYSTDGAGAEAVLIFQIK